MKPLRLYTTATGGPRTPAGKARSRFNALKHGLDAKEEVIEQLGESVEIRSDLSQAYAAENQPQGVMQTYLCETMAHNDWARKRYLKIQSQAIRSILDAQPGNALGAALLKDPAADKFLHRIERRLETSHRAWMKAFLELRRLQQSQLEEEQMLAGGAGDLVAGDGVDPVTPDPTPAAINAE